MSNPYESPTGGFPASSHGGQLPPQQEPGLFGQIRIVSILMIVQGGLDLVAGLGLMGMGVFMGFAMREALLDDPEFQQANGQSPEAMFNIMSWGYGIIGMGILLIGAINIYAGFRNFSFKNRTLGIVSMVLGLGTVFSCYCAPTSLALCVYGLIVYLNASSSVAFRLGDEGFSSAEIMATFSRTHVGQSPFQQ